MSRFDFRILRLFMCVCNRERESASVREMYSNFELIDVFCVLGYSTVLYLVSLVYT